ncbi:MAG: argininosuccinate lyase [Candidatus Aeolococcus gillhamiae]|uniref:Argininosuccinate lyase n=1 Tax=Candidatus Aeolococcus gillhamiae TaxID=3127015 RepID=A0A2W5Z4B6_9BACT|nr:MAG: argininosuccinate lyase [Candidatus Dormibacter sp. RRmetagenome_bin12]
MARGIRIVGAGAGADATPPPSTAAKMWSGRLGSSTSRRVEEYTIGIAVDRRLYAEDLDTSLAHLHMLRSVGLVSAPDARTIETGLREIRREFDRNEFVIEPGDEDIHAAIERRLFGIAGEVAGRLHTGRSRNDQVATDLRLYLREHVRRLVLAVADLETALISVAEQNRGVAMPGMTHLQHAQPVLFAHHLLAHVHALARDVDRMRDWDKRAAVSPLGSGALAGSSLPLDPAAVAAELGFDRPAANSIDAVSDRDFVAEFLFAAALLGVHLSRIGEEVILWATPEFGWVRLDDAWSTGSSIMPQKKNPDIAELARGKSGRLIGNLTGLLATLKGLPLAYDRDLQEDKEPVFDTVEQLIMLLPAVTGMIATLGIDGERLAAAAPAGFALATDVAEWLVCRGVAFREAHEISGSFVSYCEQRGLDLPELTDDQLAEVDPQLTPEVRGVLSVEAALRARSSVGGTAPARVAEQSAQLIDTVHAQVAWANAKPGS